MTFREIERENTVQHSDSDKLYPISYVGIMLVDLPKNHEDKRVVWFGLLLICLFFSTTLHCECHIKSKHTVLVVCSNSTRQFIFPIVFPSGNFPFHLQPSPFWPAACLLSFLHAFLPH